MNKKDLKKAIKNGQCVIVIDNNVEVRYRKNEEDIVNKYNVTPLNIEDIDEFVTDTVNKCLNDEGEVRHYFVENMIIRAILDRYTNMPNDVLDDNDIEMLINDDGIVWTCDGNCFIARFRNAVNEQLDIINSRNKRSNEFTKFLNQLFVPFENDETGALVRELVMEGFKNNLNK